MGERRGVYWVLVGRCEAKNCLLDLEVDVRIALQWNFRKWVGKACTGLIWLRIGAGGGCLCVRFCKMGGIS